MSQRCAVPYPDLVRRFPAGVAPRATLVRLGMSHSTISRRCRPGGPWQRPIPGVVILNNGTPTRYQLCRAALTHAGAEAVITGLEAVRLHGVKKVPKDPVVHVLIPHASKVGNWGFATVERTIHPPKAVDINGLPVAPLARALIDAARRMSKLDDIRAMIAEAVQRGLCDPLDLQTELAQGSTIGSALPRRVVSEMDAGVRSAAEAWAKSVVKRSQLPQPEWNVEIRDTTGNLLGIADGWWDDVKMAWEIDSLEYHLGPIDYARTVEKHTRLTAAGVTVVHTLPSRLRDRPQEVIRELTAAYRQASRRPPPNLVTTLSRRLA